MRLVYLLLIGCAVFCCLGAASCSPSTGRSVDYEVITPWGGYRGNTTSGTIVIDARTFFQQPQLEK